MEVAHRELAADWMYLCEDDIGLLDLPTGRLVGLMQAATTMPEVGAVVAYARDLNLELARLFLIACKELLVLRRLALRLGVPV